MNAVEKIAHEPSLPVPVNPMQMLASAVERGMAPEVIEKLMNLAERWDATNSRKAFDQAVAAAKAEIPVIVRNAKGHNSKAYADFAAIAKVVDPILGKHGITYRFRTVQTDKTITVTCVLFGHGHAEENTLCGPADQTGNKNAIQAIGSTLTYLQRYSLVQALGLAAANDDDGKAAGDGETVSQEQADAIRELLEEVGGNRAVFLKYFKCESVEQIPAKEYERVISSLKAKRTTQ